MTSTMATHATSALAATALATDYSPEMKDLIKKIDQKTQKYLTIAEELTAYQEYL